MIGAGAVTASLLGALGATTASAHPFDDIPAGHWVEAGTNTISDLDPCPQSDCSYSAIEGQSAVIDDWNGGAFATGYGELGGLVVFGGGHNGYFGNELYVFDVGTQTWIRHTDPVENPVCDQSLGELQDGSPCSAHTYDYVDYHPGTNAFVELGSASNHEFGGGGASWVHLFSFDDDQWRRGASDLGGYGGTGASSAYDPGRDVFWVIPAYNQNRLQYDPTSDAWTEYSPYNIEIDAASAVDPVHDLLVTIDGRGTQSVIVHDLGDFEAQGITVPLNGSSPVMQTAGPGFEWDPIEEVFVGWVSGPSVWTLTPPDGDWATETWEWNELPPADDNEVVPSAPNGNNTYSRWRYMPSVNAFIVVNRVDEPVYVYKLSDGEGLGPGTGDDRRRRWHGRRRYRTG